MQRYKASFPFEPEKLREIKYRMLNWANQFSILLLLDSNSYPASYGRYEFLLAVEPVHIIGGDGNAELETIQEWHDQHKDWLLGHICYDYKNELEPKLRSGHEVRTGFPILSFFCPATICYISKDSCELSIESLSAAPEDIYRLIMEMPAEEEVKLPVIGFRKRFDQDDYLATIEQLRHHIAEGDCYEVNFCNEGFAEQVSIDPISVFHKLGALSPAPFSAYYRLEDRYMMCSSPERYLYKEDDKLVAQPIKGTARRDIDPDKDAVIREALRGSIKDQAENVMIVDLMRNDLARSCVPGSVAVEELFGIYSFPQVHQMISTVTGSMRQGVPFTDAIRYSFPMGSMTGAPKVKVMELIEQYERSRRELFSGTVGYISPGGDFDFNVIIRSLFYDSVTGYLSYQTGGAITYDSVPMQEWEEMRLKAWALERIFS